MRLRRVKIFGFKTFADRTEFDLDGDVIAVVGPNGCGKSNLVDAILWGLGEGSSKNLRAQTGQDVIFSGSSRRKPVGYAEVTLLFENEDGSLPIDAPEVGVTRRLNRAGESEYSINKRPCRLKDVLDLFADSGLGKAGYSIVGQREIDQALAASPEDRRAWIDEAAGVQRYRSRKVEALKRLSGAETHLARVTDVLAEIEIQREPLRAEAEAARRYKTLQESLSTLEVGLLARELSTAARDFSDAERRIAESASMRQKELALADSLMGQAKQITHDLAAIDAQIATLRESERSATGRVQKAEAAIQLAEQRLKSLDDQALSLEDEAAAIAARISEAKADRNIAKAEAQKEREELEALRKESAGAGEERQRLAAELGRLDKVIEEARAESVRLLKLRAEAEHAAKRRTELQREAKGIERDLPGLEDALKEADAERAKAASRLVNVDDRIKADVESARVARQAEDAAAGSLRAAASRLASLEGKRKGIEATLEAHEGLNRGAKAVLTAAKAGDIPGGFRSLAECISSSQDHAVAIESALGASLHDLIGADFKAATAAIELLKSKSLGRATIRYKFPSPSMPDVPKADGVIGRASDLVQTDKSLALAVQSLLGDTLIVADGTVAMRSDLGNWDAIVTLGGDVFAAGAITGGKSGQSFGMVQRRAELKSLDAEIAEVRKLLATHEGEVAETRSKITLLEENRKEAARERETASKDLDEAREWARKVQEERDSAVKALQRISHELAALPGPVTTSVATVDIDALRAERDSLVAQVASYAADARNAEMMMRQAESRAGLAAERAVQAEKRLAAAIEASSLRDRKSLNIEPERQKARDTIEAAQAERIRAEDAAQSAASLLADSSDKRAALQSACEAATQHERSLRENAQTHLEATHEAEIARAKADAKRATAGQRLLEEYGLSELEAQGRAADEPLPADTAATVARLRRELRAMGDVNLGAIEAFDRLTERTDILGSQRADIEGGMAQILESIRELDGLTRERFLQTFASVRDAFEQIFQTLFSGGQGKLLLTVPDNVLETGIEIDVVLPGKKAQRLELLSGGERSLCATAFLFALLKAKPSPLVVLDEVDAPLDGRNVERFIGLVKESTLDSQFLIVTHNPATIEAAPMWLGVSMQEPGVSTLVPMCSAPSPVAVVAG